MNALAATVCFPLALLAACLVPPLRHRMAYLLPLAPLPGLWCARLGEGQPPFAVGAGPVQLVLALDRPGEILLLVAAVLWSIAALYAVAYMRGEPNRDRFAVSWLMGVAGCLGAFVAADMATLYLCLALLTLGACGLVFHEETPTARRAASIYLGLALFGETLVLAAMVVLAQALPEGTLLVRDAAAVLPTLPHRDLVVALLVVGFGLKAGVFPLHVWMPLAHGAAPVPASAVLSGAVVKVGIVGLGRFMPFDASLADWGIVVAAAGLFTALYGVAIGVTQRHPKSVLAYSSVSQMGVIVAVVGMGISASDSSAAIAAAYYAAHHVLVKGALFLAVGVVAATGPRRLSWIIVPTALLALSLGGLPLTGGALAKFAVAGPLGKGLAGTIGKISAAGTTLLVLHFLHRLRREAADDPRALAPAGLLAPWAVLAFAAIAVPWAMYLAVPAGTIDNPLAPAALWSATLPMLVGVAAAWALQRWARGEIPRIPQGDIAVAIEPTLRGLGHVGALIQGIDGAMRTWIAAGLALAAVTVVFGAVIGAS